MCVENTGKIKSDADTQHNKRRTTMVCFNMTADAKPGLDLYFWPWCFTTWYTVSVTAAISMAEIQCWMMYQNLSHSYCIYVRPIERRVNQAYILFKAAVSKIFLSKWVLSSSLFQLLQSVWLATHISPPQLMQKEMFWCPCTLYPIRNAIQRRSCVLVDGQSRILLFWYQHQQWWDRET